MRCAANLMWIALEVTTRAGMQCAGHVCNAVEAPASNPVSNRLHGHAYDGESARLPGEDGCAGPGLENGGCYKADYAPIPNLSTTPYCTRDARSNIPGRERVAWLCDKRRLHLRGRVHCARLILQTRTSSCAGSSIDCRVDRHLLCSRSSTCKPCSRRQSCTASNTWRPGGQTRGCRWKMLMFF